MSFLRTFYLISLLVGPMSYRASQLQIAHPAKAPIALSYIYFSA
jgi:hypothetical protein